MSGDITAELRKAMAYKGPKDRDAGRTRYPEDFLQEKFPNGDWPNTLRRVRIKSTD